MDRLLEDHHQLMRYLEERTGAPQNPQSTSVPALHCEIDLTTFDTVPQADAALGGAEQRFDKIYGETQQILQSTLNTTGHVQLPAPEESSTDLLGGEAVSERALEEFQVEKMQQKMQQLLIRESADKTLLGECKQQLETLADQLTREQEANAELARQNCKLENKLTTVRAEAEVQAKQEAAAIKTLESGKHCDKYTEKIALLQTQLSVALQELEEARTDLRLRRDVIQKPLAELRSELAQTRKTLTTQLKITEDRLKNEIMQLQTVVQLVSDRSARQDAQEQANEVLLQSIKVENGELVDAGKELRQRNEELATQNAQLTAANNTLNDQLRALLEKQRVINQECAKSQSNIIRMKNEYDRVVAEARRLKTAYDELRKQAVQQPKR